MVSLRKILQLPALGLKLIMKLVDILVLRLNSLPDALSDFVLFLLVTPLSLVGTEGSLQTHQCGFSN